MTQSVSLRYAGRSLFRHARRTILSIVGIGVASGLSLFMVAFVRGERTMMLNAAAGSGIGHIRIVPTGWLDARDNNLRIPQWRDMLIELRRHPDVAIATPHMRIEGLLAMGTRSIGVELVGVDPNTEQAVNRLVRTVTEGRYLDPGEQGFAVIGQAIAERLAVTVDDQLMVTATDRHGQIAAAMLRIVGLIEIGSRDLESTLCHVAMADVAQLSGQSHAGDITLMVRTPKQLDRVQAALDTALPDTVAVVTWKEIMPEMASAVKIDETWTRLIVSIIMIVAFLGIASAQLAAVLERRREFAVLAALGMKHGRLVYVMVVEGLILGLFGAITGLILGSAAAYYVATEGIDFTKFYGEGDWSMSNMLIDPVFYGEFGWWLVPLAFVLSLSATLLSSIYPAWYASRTDTATALRVDN
jgi:ABC-type lipoprotein release transport system permease subunit